jgi:hypothetical protein
MKRLFFVLFVVAWASIVHAQDIESLHIFFPANSANLRGVSPELALENQKVLTEIAQVMLHNPQYRLLIDGHANPVLRTSREEAEALTPLSLQRARAVANYLVELYKIDRQRLILSGAGGRYSSGGDAAQNRRVSFFIITDNRNITITEKRNVPVDRAGLTEEINNLIPDNILEAISELGMQINEGKNPPNIEGTYFIDTLLMVENTTGITIATQYNKKVTFSGQDNTVLTINAHYTLQIDNNAGPMSSSGPGSYIVGEGNKFTVVVDGTREQGGYTAKTVEIFSGEISDQGILNYHWAVMMVDNNGDPLNAWIPNGTGYAKRDGDGISERVQE